MFTIACVSAGDDTQNEVLSVSNDDYVIADSQKTLKDLRDLINDAQDNAIKLNDDYIYDYDSDWSLTDGIEINRDLTIDGQGHTLDGGESMRIFKATAGTVTIKNIIFKNGWASGDHDQHGGAIMDYGADSVTAVNCTFKNNYASQNGGAMYKGSAVNCIFIGNSASQGGALYDVSAVNCTFSNNQANYNDGYSAGGGGAMYHNSAVNCNFTGNSAKSDGGAIYDGSAVNCYFSDNSAGISGGAMRYGTVKNCTFTSTNVDSTDIWFDVSNTVVAKGGKILFKYLPECDLKVSADGKEFTATDKGWNVGKLGVGTHNVTFTIQHKTNTGKLQTKITVIPNPDSELDFEEVFPEQNATDINETSDDSMRVPESPYNYNSSSNENDPDNKIVASAGEKTLPATGNPIMLVLLALLAVGVGGLRRRL